MVHTLNMMAMAMPMLPEASNTCCPRACNGSNDGSDGSDASKTCRPRVRNGSHPKDGGNDGNNGNAGNGDNNNSGNIVFVRGLKNTVRGLAMVHTLKMMAMMAMAMLYLCCI